MYNGKRLEVISVELTRSEMEIMDVLWNEGKPLSRSDLLQRNEEKSWKDSSVHILLNGLLQKGAIEEAGFVRRSKTYGRTFVPTMSREQYFATTIFSHRYQPDMIGLLEALLSRPEVDENVLEALKVEKKFLMEQMEPMCINKVPREGFVIRKANDPIKEAWKLKTTAFGMREAKQIDAGEVDMEMSEGYTDN